MAGATNTYNPKIKSPERVIVAGSFVVNNSSAPTTVRGDGFTVGAPTNGHYTIALTDGRYEGLDSLTASLVQSTSGAAAVIVTGDPQGTINSDGTFELETHSTLGTEANLNNGEEVHFLLVLRNTGAGRRY